jgi:hypothetical protein
MLAPNRGVRTSTTSSAAGSAAPPQAANRIEPITNRLRIVILLVFIFSPQIFFDIVYCSISFTVSFYIYLLIYLSFYYQGIIASLSGIFLHKRN